jgi:hypothetical protein
MRAGVGADFSGVILINILPIFLMFSDENKCDFLAGNLRIESRYASEFKFE